MTIWLPAPRPPYAIPDKTGLLQQPGETPDQAQDQTRPDLRRITISDLTSKNNPDPHRK